MKIRKSSIRPDRLLACAVLATRTAGRHAQRNRKRRQDAVQIDAHDVKLQLDIECQRKAEKVIRKAFPDHPILGEENSGRQDHAHMNRDFLWIIDPIDGTVNFSHGLPIWCCSIAVQFRGKTVAGAVFAPALHDLFTAVENGPALRNGEKIKVSSSAALTKSVIMTGMDKNVDPRLRPLELFGRIATKARKARIMGSAALDICRVACGEADGYFEAGIYLWDVAAAEFIVRQAGGETEILQRYEEPHRLSFMATNGKIHRDLKTLLS